MTYNTSLRPSEALLESSAVDIGNATIVLVQSESLNYSKDFSSLLNKNGSIFTGLLEVASVSRSLSTDSWWHIFFLFDLFGQITSEGSMANFVAKGDKLTDFIITIGTTTALIVDVCTLNVRRNTESLNFLHSLAIFRLIRATKISFLLPL